jgi:hypothetical protein
MRSSKQVFDEQFPSMRERCLSLAADLDRVGRADGGWDAISGDARLEQLRQAIALLSDAGPDRARRVLETFSDKTTTIK